MVGGMPEPPHCACKGMPWTFEVSLFQILNSSPTRPVYPSPNHFGTFRRAMRLLCAISFRTPRRILLLGLRLELELDYAE
jgi:hypothetical protein